MASTAALLTGLTGLTAHARRLEVIGNNISNVNTTAFKSNRAVFAPSFSRNLSLGSQPSGASGGSNPAQVGLGVGVGATQRNFTNGGVSSTGVNTDMAIEGDGFFVVERGGQQLFTRAGSFDLNAQNELVTATGERVQGFAADEEFNIVDGRLTSVNIPLGSLTVAEETDNVTVSGNLNADNEGLPTQGALISFDQPFENTGGAAMAPGDALVDNLQDPNNPGDALLPSANEPYTFTISGADKGGKTLPDASLTVDGSTTVQDFLDFIDDSLGIEPGLTNPDGATTGAQIDGAGNITVVGNIGEDNNLTFDESNLSIEDSSGSAVTNPFTLSQDSETGVADGESVRTTFIVHDSLGNPLEVDLTLAFQSADDTGTTWRYFMESADKVDPMDPGLSLDTGTVSFDTQGELVSDAPISAALPRVDTGAESPVDFSLSLTGEEGSVTALADTQQDSSIGATFEDGSAIGTLSNFSVSEDGVINGGFTNGLSRTIGQVAIGKFTNPEGLVDEGNSLFRIGANSGAPAVTTPGQLGTGRIIGGALELSNVDLGQQFTRMIETSTGYSASSRVITESDQLLQQLVAIAQ